MPEIVILWKIQTEADKEDVLSEPKMPGKCQSADSTHLRGLLDCSFPHLCCEKIKITCNLLRDNRRGPPTEGKRGCR